MGKIKKRLLFESLFNNAGVGIAVVNEEGLFIRANAKLCAMGGYTEEDLLQKPFKEFSHQENVEEDLQTFSELLSGTIDAFEEERRYVKKNGQMIWCLVTVSVARQQDGSVLIITVVQDIDARKKVEEALYESEKQLRKHNAYKDKAFSIIAHDLKGPVNSIAHALEIIEKKSATLPKEKIVDLVSKLRISAFKTSEMLESLLMWSCSQLREVKVKPIPLSLAGEIKKATGQLQQQAYEKGISVQVQISEEMQVRADRNMLHVILRNLISNAIKFSMEGKLVSINAVEKDAFVHVSVTDEGMGMSEECKLRLLNRNMEGFTSYGTKGEKGTGLGINLCMDYIERNRGSLQIISEEGKGSTFTFSVPAITVEQV